MVGGRDCGANLVEDEDGAVGGSGVDVTVGDLHARDGRGVEPHPLEALVDLPQQQSMNTGVIGSNELIRRVGLSQRTQTS
jgi:hypothetical protein